MDLQTEDVEKILAAIAPALRAEVTRVLGEAQQGAESGLQARIENAVKEAETELRRTADQRLEQAVAEATETAKRETAAEIQQKTAQLDQRTADWNTERTELQTQAAEWKALAGALGELSGAGSQPEMLVRFIRQAESFAPSFAVYTAKPDGLALWKFKNGVFPAVISKDTADPSCYFRPIAVRGRVVAAICAQPPVKTAQLDYLVVALEQAVTLFAVKLQEERANAGTPKANAIGAGAAANGSGPSSQESVHAEAHLAARTMVTQLKLGHEREVRDGRANADLYQRLRNEIEMGREQYRERFESQWAATLPKSEDPFHEALVRVLADGDASRLGPDYPGPKVSARS